jgi:hypothetical protein
LSSRRPSLCDVLLLPLVWTVLLLLTLGCGLGLVTALARRAGPGFRHASIMQTFWLGYAAIIAVLELGSLVRPIDAWALLFLASCSLVGWGAGLRQTRRCLHRWLAKPGRTLRVAALLSFATLVVAASAARPVTWFDTYLYHLQVVRWTVDHPAVPGLANLHARLGFNNSAHLFAALTEVLWPRQSAHLALGFLVLASVLHHLELLLGRAGSRSSTARAAAPITLVYVAVLVATHQVASLSTDGALAVLVVAAFLEMLDTRRAAFRAGTSLTVVAALATTAFTTKLGGLPMVAASAVLVGWRSLRARRLVDLVAPLVLPAALLVGFFARQAVLSGWLLFPMPYGNLHLSWSLPRQTVVDVFETIKCWARLPNHDTSEVLANGFLFWFRPWFAGFARSKEAVLLPLALAVGAVALGLRASSRPAAGWPAGLGAARLTVVASLMFWFLGAPDLRFGRAFFWLLLAVLAAPIVIRLVHTRGGRFAVAGASALLALWAGAFSITLPGSAASLPPLAHFEAQVVRLESGLQVLVPIAANDRCGDALLPCTPTPARQRARKPGHLGAGFLPE